MLARAELILAADNSGRDLLHNDRNLLREYQRVSASRGRGCSGAAPGEWRRPF
jgi:hypothetical protein